MAILGVLARVDTDYREQTVDSLCEIKGVDVFSVEQEEQIGILIEKPTLVSAQQTFFEQVEITPGILCAWPVFSNLD